MRHQAIKADNQIHPAWCGCGDCEIEARRAGLGRDILAIALGALAGLALCGWLLLGAH